MFKHKEILKLKISFWKLTHNFSAMIHSLKNKDFDSVYMLHKYQTIKDIGTYEFNEVVIFSMKTENKELQKALDEHLQKKYGFSYKDYLENIFFQDHSFLYIKLNHQVYNYLKKTFPLEMTQVEKIHHVLGKFFTHSKPDDFKMVLNDNLSFNLDLEGILKNSRYYLYENPKKTDIRLKALINANLVDINKTEHIDYFLKIYHKPSDYMREVFNLPDCFDINFFNEHPLLVKYPKFKNEFINLNLSQIPPEQLELLYNNLPDLDEKIWKKLINNNKEFFMDIKNVNHLIQTLIKNNITSDLECKLSPIFKSFKKTDELLFNFNDSSQNLNHEKEAIIKNLLAFTDEHYWSEKFKQNFNDTENYLRVLMRSIYYYSNPKYQQYKETLLNIAIDNKVNILIQDKYEPSLLEQYTYHIGDKKSSSLSVDIDEERIKEIPLKVYEKIEALLTKEALLSNFDVDCTIAQKLLSEKIDILSIFEKRGINPFLNYEIPLEVIVNAPNAHQIPDKVAMFYIENTTTEQLLKIHEPYSNTLNITHYVSRLPELFNVYFKDDTLFNLLSLKDKKDILENFLKYPDEKTANFLLNNKLDWPWEKVNTSYYTPKTHMDEKLKEQISKKIDYINIAQEKEKLENIFKDDTIVNEESEKTIPILSDDIIVVPKTKKRNKI
jgi:hypothetical protein